MSILSTGGGASLSLPLNLGNGKFVIDVNGNVTITPTVVSGAALQIHTANGDLIIGLDSVTGASMRVSSSDVYMAAGTGGDAMLIDASGAVSVMGHNTGQLAFFNGTPAAQQTLTSGTATPEQIALALEASTLMGGT